MKIKQLNDKFAGKRVAVKNTDDIWFAGKLNYVTTNHFSSWGTIAYFGRFPFRNIQLDSMYEYEDLLDLREGDYKTNTYIK